MFTNLNVIFALWIYSTSIIFATGFLGLIVNRKNFLTVIISIELLLLAIDLNFAIFSIYIDDITGQIFVIFILAIAAVESAIGLSIMTIFYKLKNTKLIKPTISNNNYTKI